MGGSAHTPEQSPGAPLLAVIDRAAEQLRDVEQLVTLQERAALDGLVAAAVAHEISNILTPVRSYAERALMHLNDREAVQGALERAAAGASQACRAVDAILESVRGATPVPRATPLDAAVSAVAALVDGVEVSTAGDTAATAAIGQSSLEQVLINLLLNARAASVGVARVEVRWSSVLRVGAGRLMRIEVQDHGRGIPAHFLDGLWDPRRTEATSRRGLGLLICRFLVEAVGGRITAASRVGVGTCFIIELPAGAEAASEAA